MSKETYNEITKSFKAKRLEFEKAEDEAFDYFFNLKDMCWTYKLANILRLGVYCKNTSWAFPEISDVFNRLFCPESTKQVIFKVDEVVSELFNPIPIDNYFLTIEDYYDAIIKRDEDEDDECEPINITYSDDNGHTWKNISNNMIAELAMNMVKETKCTTFYFDD